MALQSSLLLDPYPEELPAAPHSSLLFDPYPEEPPAGSAGSAGSATENDDGVSQSLSQNEMSLNNVLRW